MKTKLNTAFFFVLVFLAAIHAKGQDSAEWTREMNAFPDLASVNPVRTLSYDTNVYVLSTYRKDTTSGIIFKIYLNKYTESGALRWSLIYDNGGSGNPEAFDMAVDGDGNCYVAGGFWSSNRPLLLKVSAGGSVVWQRDSTIAFNSGSFSQVLYRNHRLSVAGSGTGIASFDLDGNEKWSTAFSSGLIAVDYSGRVIANRYDAFPKTIFRYDSSGVLNFSDSTIQASRIAVDAENNFYLLEAYSLSPYILVKYDSAGTFQWIDSLSQVGGFGDFGYDVLTDYNNDVIVVGLNDTMYKFTSAGDPVWAKSMHGLDGFTFTSTITFDNFIAIAGTSQDSAGNKLSVGLFNLKGNQTWEGVYRDSGTFAEYAKDISVEGYRNIYVAEEGNSKTTLVKFAPPYFTDVDYRLVCVDSVWYENQDLVNVRVFNGSVGFINYPSEQGISPAGDTIINPRNTVWYYGQAPNSYQVYTDTITNAGITDFSGFTFVLSNGFADTTVVISWCLFTGTAEALENEMIIYPNPVNSFFIVQLNKEVKDGELIISDMLGKELIHKKLTTMRTEIDRGNLKSGIYFVRVREREGEFAKKLIVE